jgi:hypothetical protein
MRIKIHCLRADVPRLKAEGTERGVGVIVPPRFEGYIFVEV